MRWKSASLSFVSGQKRSTTTSSTASLGKNSSSFSSSGRTSAYSTSLSKKSSDLSAASSSSSVSNSGNNGGGDDDSDSWITDYGTYAIVNDDIRHSIRAEIEDIDTSIQQIQVGIQQEERTSSQLAKDTSHAQSEMVSYRRSSVELMDSASMNEQIRLDLEKTLQVDLVQPLSETPSHNERKHGDGEGDDSTSKNNKENQQANGGDSNTNDGKPASNHTTTKKFIQHTKHRAEAILRSGKSTTIAKAKAECKVLEDEIASIEQRIQTENLPQLLEQKKEETKARRQDLEAELSRKKTLQAAIQQSRMRCGGFAQDIADKRKTLVENRKEHETKKASLREQLEATEAELRKTKSKEQWEAELAAVEKERDAAIKMIADAESMIENRKMVQKESEAIQVAINELKVAKEEMKAKVSVLQDRVNKCEADLESAKKDADEVEAMKDDNDRFEAEKVMPAKSELNDVLKEKEQVAQCINEAHEALKTHTEQVTAAGQEGEKELQQLNEEVGEIQKQLAEKTSMEEDLKRSKEVSDEAHQKEVQELEESVDRLEKAAKSEQEYADERSRDTKQKVEQAKAAKEEAIYIRKGRERYQAVLEMGVELVKATESTIKRVREASSDDEESAEENE